MLLEIDDWRSVGDLRYRFNKCFPNLQLQFFDNSGKSETEIPVMEGILLEDIRRKHNPGVLSIKSWYTCTEVAQVLAHQYGLKVQVVPAVPLTQTHDRNFAHYKLQDLNALAGKELLPGKVVTGSAEDLEGW